MLKCAIIILLQNLNQLNNTSKKKCKEKIKQSLIISPTIHGVFDE